MATTVERFRHVITPGAIVKAYDASAANTALTVSTPTTGNRLLRITAVYVKYSANVTQNVTITYNAAHGAAYDTLHATITLTDADEGVFIPDEEAWFFPTDAYDVLAPAGGGVVTSAITIFCEEK